MLKSDPLLAELDSILQSPDSTSILSLIDSLLYMPEVVETSQWALRLGYNSNVASASRALQFNQFGLTPGISYYHKSGFYADLAAYWSNEFQPNLYLTIPAIGYMHSLTPWWTAMAEYNHFFYLDAADTDTASITYTPYTNSLGLTQFFDWKKLLFRLDYHFLFGDKSAHRITPGISLNLRKRNWRKIDRILFAPSANMLIGSETVFQYKLIDERPISIAIRQRLGLPLYYEVESKEFGILNYSFSAPMSIVIKNWAFLVNYSYNIPRALPGEELSLTNSGFASFSITRFFDF